jgi:hypothetical protein
MARLIIELPSSGKSRPLFIPSGTNSGFINTTFFTLIDANDYSVESQGDPVETPDPANAGRVLKPGVIRFLAPLIINNTTATSRWVELQVITETNESIVLGRVIVPASEAISYPIQGQHLTKFNFAAALGGRLQIRAEVNNALRCYGTAVESGAADHLPAEV